MESGRKRGVWTFRWLGRRWGFERSDIWHGGSLYMTRHILYLYGYTLRLHHIMRSDRDRALHNHPFWFITFPLGTYRESYWVPWCTPKDCRCDSVVCSKEAGHIATRTVLPFRPQFRGIDFRHRINDVARPVWTIVISGPYRQTWGFFPKPDEFVSGLDWDDYIATRDNAP